MYFEISGITVNPLIPPLVAFFISFFTSTGGVSGAFLILPFQVSVLGFTGPAVSATNHLYNVVAIPGGVYRYIKEGRMVWPLAWIVIVGTLPGIFIGLWLRVTYLMDPTTFKVFAGFVLLYIGVKLVTDILSRKKTAGQSSEERFRELVMEFNNKAENIESGSRKKSLPRVKTLHFGFKKTSYEFYGEVFEVPTLKITLISFIIGIAGGAYGIGGGAIMAPLYVALFNLPVYTVAGAALLGTFITSFVSVISYQAISPYVHGHIAPDWVLGFLFGIGGLAGTYCGARLQKFMPAKIIKWILGFGIVFLALSYIYNIIKLFKVF
jgi:uncharacterized membrane protein YfcA